MKVIDKINEHVAKGQNFFSFEFFPPKTEEVRPGSVSWVIEFNVSTFTVYQHNASLSVV